MAKGSRWVKWGFLGLIVPVATGLAAWQGWTWWSWATAPVAASEVENSALNSVQIAIPAGTTGQQIGRDLEAAGLIRSALAWKLWSGNPFRTLREAFRPALTPSILPTRWKKSPN